MTVQKNVFGQLGAGRDGLDNFRDVAVRRGMPTALIDPPDYQSHRSRRATPSPTRTRLTGRLTWVR